ncbi:MAG: OmpA family protein, partial [Bacteroidota bacterium]
IYGYTDRIGEEDVNKRISERRAQAVARRLRIPDAKVEGLGESDLLFDNELPEGRFYCRTVRIIIETSVHDDDDE